MANNHDNLEPQSQPQQGLEAERAAIDIPPLDGGVGARFVSPTKGIEQNIVALEAEPTEQESNNADGALVLAGDADGEVIRDVSEVQIGNELATKEPAEAIVPVKTSGRRAAVNVLDTILGKADNMVKLANAMQEEFDKDPVTFFRRIAMPLLPKQVEVHNDKNDGFTLNVVMVDAKPRKEVECEIK